MRRLIVVLMAVLALSVVAVPLAQALTRVQAASTLQTATRSRSACGQGFWVCNSYELIELSKLAGLNPQWSGTGGIQRFGGGEAEFCVVSAAINSNGTIHSSAVTCRGED